MTGFSRRIMASRPWMNFFRPVLLEDLPDWDKFIAGRDASTMKRAFYQSTVREKHSDLRYSKQTIYLYLFTMGIIIIAIIATIIISCIKKKF